MFNKLNNKIDPNYILKTYKYISKNVSIPKFITNKLRSNAEKILRDNDPSKFDNLDTFIQILIARFTDIKNSLSDINKAIDRNSIRIEELEETKNNKINFYEYSEKFTNPEFKDSQNQILTHTIKANSGHVEGFISDGDSGLELTEQVIDNKSFIKIELDDSKIDGINFVSHSSVKVKWNESLHAYELFQNDIYQYDSKNPETTINIKHNLGTRALDVKVFKFDPQDLELKTPIVTGMEYPSDNEVIIYLTSPQLISVLISRI